MSKKRHRRSEADEIAGFLQQRNISRKNNRRLAVLCRSSNPDIACKVRLVSEVAKLRPGRRKRMGFLVHNRRDLLDGLVEMGLLEYPVWIDDPFDDLDIPFDDEAWLDDAGWGEADDTAVHEDESQSEDVPLDFATQNALDHLWENNEPHWQEAFDLLRESAVPF